jgi:hypothetical protein
MPEASRIFISGPMMFQVDQYLMTRYKLDPVAASTTQSFRLDLTSTKGVLISVKVQCLSTSYDVYIMPFENVDIDSLMTIYRKTDINKLLEDTNLSSFWAKFNPFHSQKYGELDTDKCLYFKIENKAEDTGDIYVELIYRVAL